jgi:catalase-peroxidase
MISNLLDMTTTWKPVSEDDAVFEGRNRTTGEGSDRYTQTLYSVLTQSYALLLKLMVRRFIRERNDFIKAKVMNLDRFDL